MHRTIAVTVTGLVLAGASLSSCNTADGDDTAAATTAVAATEVLAAETTTARSTTQSADAASTVPASDVTDATETTVSTDSTQVLDGARALATFPDAASVDAWANVDDTVMGGVSASTTSWESQQLVFAGDLSLENNGGFTSVRGPQDPSLGALISGATDLVVDAAGDGRTYVLQLRTADESLYIAGFDTLAGERQRIVMPLTSFEPVTRFLDPLPDGAPLAATAVVQLAIYLLDGREGPFRLAVSGITAE